ncbi:MAG: cobalamin-binding protein [Candidatus Omnitrophica bacterium]|nr:cobalamin-binding protein [Candidatus Omnitrophota bacterium]
MNSFSWKLRGVAVMTVFLGCGMEPADEMPPRKAVAVSTGFPRTVTDSFGHSATISSQPLRIASTTPSNTEILFAIGAGSQVVGVTAYCNFPAEAGNRDKIGGFSPESISIERIAGLRCDLVLTTGGIQQPLTESLRKLGLTVLSYDAQTLEDVIRNVRLIGQATGHSDEAEALAALLDQRLQRMRQRFAALPAINRPRVFFLLSDDPLMTAGRKTFAGQMIELAGGSNVFADVAQEFPRVSEEEVIKRNPAVILTWERGASRKKRIRQRPGWNQLAAGRDGRILTIDDDLISRPGPRLFDGLERLADLLHSPPAQKDQR